MNDRERRASKYLPFESLKGLKERIALVDQLERSIRRPLLSEDEKFEMNVILFDCYSRNKAVTIYYYKDGILKDFSGVIQKIDILNKQIIFLPKKKFLIDTIYKIEMK